MKIPLRSSLVLGMGMVALSSIADKKPLDPSVYDGWKSIRGTTLSRDGEWLAFVVTPQEGDAVTTVRSLKDGHTVSIPRAANLRFTADSKFLVATVAAPFAEVKAARRKKTKPDDMPKAGLMILNLASGQITQVDRVSAYFLAEDDQGYLAYQTDPVPPAKPPVKDPAVKDPTLKEPPSDKKAGKPLVIRNLITGKEETVPLVSGEAVARHGGGIIFATSSIDGKSDGVTYLDYATDHKTLLTDHAGDYPQLAVDADGKWAAYEFKIHEIKPAKDPAAKDASPKKDEKPADPKPPVPAELYLASLGVGSKSAKPMRIGQDSLPKGWVISDKGSLRFSKRGARLIYGTAPAPQAPAKEVPDDEKVSVDVWTWKDQKLMPQQLLEAEDDRNRAYLAAYDLGRKSSLQIQHLGTELVVLTDEEDGRYAVEYSTQPYRLEASWDPGWQDLTVLDLTTGKEARLATHAKFSVSESPKGETIACFDSVTKHWSAYQCATGKTVLLSDPIPFPTWDELDDHPDVPLPYGIAGWASETQPILQDRFDLWLCDSTGKATPRRLTDGRVSSTRFQPISLDRDEKYVKLDGSLLSAFNDDDKRGGVYRLAGPSVTKLVMDDKTFGGFVKAKNSERMVFTRQDFVEFPDLWVTDTQMDSPVKVSDANPQQKDYNWGKAELVHWTSLDGQPLSGILIKPENFSYSKKYPLVTYFYERLSEDLNVYHAPSPSASTINWSYFASNGYCIFVPDIPYRVGYPGYSSLSAIVPGVQSIVSRGYIDPKRLGIQGQSWGGYQVAYLVTQTSMFAAAEAGAPVSDMFSAYGGIRYGSGLVREMQYEHGQSRIGGTPWDSTLRYIENSPVFFADKVTTPLMIMSNDQDGAVPHTQGIEYFTALRRLGKPSWMVVYNGEDHNIVERKNRKDFTIRLSQFFDHFLKGAPAPVWMQEGIAAVDKGRTMGLDLEPVK